jgi:hypothetical protein
MFEFYCPKCEDTTEVLLSYQESLDPQCCHICMEQMTKEVPIPALGKVIGGTPNLHPFRKRK